MGQHVLQTCAKKKIPWAGPVHATTSPLARGWMVLEQQEELNKNKHSVEIVAARG